MCTVVFIPGKDGYYFASLRDENTERPSATSPVLYAEGKNPFVAPKDGLSGGTWVGVNQTGNIIILLNGGEEKHTVKKYYRKSRGLIVTELLVSENPLDDWKGLNLTDIEPFTLIVWSCDCLFQLRWDGEEKTRIQKDVCQPHIWSSSTLYNSAARIKRESVFQQWVATKPVIDMDSLYSFFLSDTDTENGFIINRNQQIKTLSYTFINLKKEVNACIKYYDFTKKKLHHGQIMLYSKERSISNPVFQ